MRQSSRTKRKKYFSIAEANARLPLLRSILRDVTELAGQLRDRHDRLKRLREEGGFSPGQAYNEELDKIETAFEAERQRMTDYESELRELGVELKDYFTGLIDFPSLRDGRDIYLCWRLGEECVEHWHELDAGFAGRQKLRQSVGSA